MRWFVGAGAPIECGCRNVRQRGVDAVPALDKAPETPLPSKLMTTPEHSENFEVHEDALVEEEGQDFENYEVSSSSDLAEAVTQITERVLETIENASLARENYFFPKGIDTIEVSVDIGGIKASVKIGGRA